MLYKCKEKGKRNDAERTQKEAIKAFYEEK